MLPAVSARTSRTCRRSKPRTAFRTAPLWELAQRIFFLHDGRTTDRVEAIRSDRSAGNRRFGPSQANRVIDRYDELGELDKQDLMSFLRSTARHVRISRAPRKSF